MYLIATILSLVVGFMIAASLGAAIKAHEKQVRWKHAAIAFCTWLIASVLINVILYNEQLLAPSRGVGSILYNTLVWGGGLLGYSILIAAIGLKDKMQRIMYVAVSIAVILVSTGIYGYVEDLRLREWASMVWGVMALAAFFAIFGLLAIFPIVVAIMETFTKGGHEEKE